MGRACAAQAALTLSYACCLVAAADTVWAYVLEQQEADPSSQPTYKLRLTFAEFPAAENVGHLAKSVKDELYKSGYFAPEKTRIFRDNPFEEADEEVKNDDSDSHFHFSGSAVKLGNDQPIEDADREATRPFYVLVSKLREQQPATAIAAAPFAALRGSAGELVREL